jgi:ABC-type Zn2+ transport system substrate-binding protein/surface adhesin
MTDWSEKIKGVVVMVKGKMQKLIAALALVGFVGSASLPIIAEASPYHHDREEQRIEHQREEHRIAEHRRHDRREEHRRHNDHESHSDTGNLVTGLIIGGVVGAVIANN